MNAILEALDREPLDRLRTALQKPRVFHRFVRAKYLPRPASEDQSLNPDGQEALEAVIVDEKRMKVAAWTWARLSKQERETLQEVTDRICGNGQGEALAYGLNIRIE